MSFFSSPPLRASVGAECPVSQKEIHEAGNLKFNSENLVKIGDLIRRLDACGQKKDADSVREMVYLATGGTGTVGGTSKSSSGSGALIVGGVVVAGGLLWALKGGR